MANQRVLIVDDNPANVLLLQRIVHNLCETVAAYNGHEALDIIGQQSIDLVLLDIMMPGIDGIAVLKTVRESYDSTELPVILISALTENRHIIEGLQAGANDYINKPFEPEVALARVETQLQLKALADERNKLVKQLQQANKMRDRLMRMASHDLKNPINSMFMALKIMEDGASREDQPVLDVAYKSLQQMHDIVLDFLDMEILHDDDVKVEINTIAIDTLIQDVLESFRMVAEKKDIQLEYQPHDIQIIGDAKRLQQVLINIVSNAIKYSPPGESVIIMTEIQNELARIHIIDRGVGIPENEQSKLFQPFARISTQPTAGEDSTGLGLWIAQQMIEVQNGRLGLSSKVGEGCDFWIELPLVSDRETMA